MSLERGQGLPEDRRLPILRVTIAIERLLLGAVALSVALIVVGVALSLVRDEGLPRDVVGFADMAAALAQGLPAAYLSLGLMALIATPVLRVIGSLVVFALDRDWRYVLVAVAVLAIIAASVMIGRT